MKAKYVLLICLATCVSTITAKISKSEEDEVDAIVAAIQGDQAPPKWDSEPAESVQLSSVYGPPPVLSSVQVPPVYGPPSPVYGPPAAVSSVQASPVPVVESNALPYNVGRNNFFGSVGIHKPPGTFAISTGGIFAAQAEVLRLIEAFLNLKGQVFGHLLEVFNNNYDLIRGLGNFLVSKVPHLHAFALKGISVLRKILEFAVHTFSEWTINLPGINFEASHQAYTQPEVQPHATYGVPSLNVAGFLENLASRR